MISKLGINYKKKRTPIGVRFLFGETGTDRFEDLNADVRWTSARIRLDGFDTMIILFVEKNNATNLAGTCSGNGYLKCTLITKRKAHQMVCFSFSRNRTGQI